MKSYNTTVLNEKGSALVIAMLVLTLLTMMGITAIRTTDIEIQISGNDKLAKIAFYGADNGSETLIELLEQNIFAAGFDNNGSGNGTFTMGVVTGTNPTFYMNETPGTLLPSDNNRDAFMPAGYAGSAPHTNLRAGGVAELSDGNAAQMAAGYEGKGKGLAGAGGHIVYDIASQRTDIGQSRAAVHVQWQHVF